MKTLVDNDCALKICRYDLVAELLETIGDWKDTFVLPTAFYSLKIPTKGLASPLAGSIAATDRLRSFLENAQEITPKSDSEYLARLAVHPEIDAGEAILFSVGLDEIETIVFTGDKRAIAALSEFLDNHSLRKQFEGRIKCLEQIIAEMVQRYGFELMHAKIMADGLADISLRLCFRSGREADANYGLRSHYGALQDASGGLLAACP